MDAKTILILCFLGDPTLPSGSLSGTGGFNASVKDIFDFLINTSKFNCIFITNTTGNYTETATIQVSSNVTLHRLFSPAVNLLHKNNFAQEIETYEIAVEKIVEDFSNISFIHSFYWMSGLIASKLSEKYQCPFIHTTVSLSKQKLISGYQPAITQQLEYENYFLHKAKYILAITDEEKRILMKYYNIEDKKIIVEGQNVAIDFHHPLYDNYGVPQGISQKNNLLKPMGFDELGISDSTWWNSGAFTYVGRVTQTKGLELIIKAWIELDKQFDESIPPLWIIGNTPYEIDKFRKTIGIPLNILTYYEHSKRIVWWGYLNPAAISTLYLKTAVLVTHSAFEGGGRVILEALCQGIPVISTNTGFGKDFITDWLNGFIVDYGDIKKLMLRMSHFVTNPTLSSVLGENARNVFQKIEANWNHNTRIKNLYNALLNECEYVNSYSSNLDIVDNAFKKGIVTTYPYFYYKPTTKDIATFTNTTIKEKLVTSPSDYEELSSAYIWKYKEKYLIKNIYPKLNKRKLWDKSEKYDVWSTSEIINKYNFSNNSPVILSPISVSKEKLLIIFPYMSMFSSSEIEEKRYDIATCLKVFSEVSTSDRLIGFSFATYWENLKICIQRLKNQKITTSYEKIAPLVNSYLSNPKCFSDNICIQYAQPLLGHVGIYENEIHLLPTYHWKYTQCGLDAGLLLWEILVSKDCLYISETYTMVKSFSQIWEIPETQILSWSFCIYLEEIICNTIFQNKTELSTYQVYLHLIEISESFI